jgi:hypothetical protein
VKFALAKTPENEVRVFLLGDAVACAKVGTQVGEGFYNIQFMLNRVVQQGSGEGPQVAARMRAAWTPQSCPAKRSAALWTS